MIMSDRSYEEELLCRIKATKELEKLGYKKTVCDKCEGNLKFYCHYCNGRGYKWIAPLKG